MQSGEIRTTRCNVFEEDLSYFFVGRPAYRSARHDDTSQPEVWQMPLCFVFAFGAVTSPERIYPFDSGAFSSGRMPSYIGMFERDYYEVSSVPDATRRIIGSYFIDARRYLEGKARPREVFESDFDLNLLDAEILALHSLCMDRHNRELDDRRMTIEVQSRDSITLSVKRPLAVIMPSELMTVPGLVDHIENKWGAATRNYHHSTSSVREYYGQIYAHVHELYNGLGLL